MINSKDLVLDNRVFGKKYWLIDVKPSYEYVDGAKTDKVDGYKYIVVLPEMKMEKLSVKIAGNQIVDAPDGYAECRFEELKVTPYVSAGNINLAATATNIVLNGKQ